jgi:AsmA family
MRDLFVIIGSLLIAALLAAFAVPRFIDWTPYRGEIERRVETATGLKLAIEGPLRLTFLPQVELNAQNAVLHTPQGNVRAARLRLQLSASNLIAGRPRIGLVEFGGAVVELADGIVDDPLDALVSLLSGNGRQLQIDAINLDDVAITRADATRLVTIARGEGGLASSQGPLRLNLEGMAGETKGRLRLAVDAPEPGGKRRVQLSLDSDGGEGPRARLTFDGQTAPPAMGGPVTLDGSLTLAQGLPRASASPNVEPALWRAQAKAHVERRSVRLAEVELSRERAAALRLNGQGALDWSASPRLSLDLSARRLALDPLLESATAPSGSGTLGGALRTLSANVLSAVPPGLAVDFDVGAETAEIAGESFESVRIKGAAGVDGLVLSSLNAKWPGRGEISFADTPTQQQDALFSGHVAVNTPDAAALLQGLGLASEAAGTRVPLNFSAQLNRTASFTQFDKLDLTLAGSRVTGGLTVSDAQGSEPPRVDAYLASPELDLNTWPIGAITQIVPRSVEGQLQLRVDTLRAGRGAGDVGRLEISLTRTHDQTRFDKLQLQGFQGLTLTGVGTIGGAESSFAARIAAPKAAPLVALSRLLLPPRAVELLAARGAAIEPLALALSGRRDAASPNNDIALSGTAAATRIDIKAALDADLSPVSGEATLSAQEATSLLRQFGLSLAPGDPLGRGEARIVAKPESSGQLAVTASMTAGSMTIGGDGTFTFDGGTQGQGGFAITTPSTATAARLIGWAPRLEGDQRFDMSGGWMLAPDSLQLDRLNAHLLGSALTGTLTLALGGQPRLTGTVRAPTLSVPGLAAMALGRSRAQAGQDAWASARFPTFAPPPLPISLDISAAFADLGANIPARDASLTLAMDERGIALSAGTAAFLGGRLSGDWRIDRDGGLARSVLHLSPEGVELKGLVPGAGLSGKLTGRIELAGAGETFAQTVASAGGGGSLRVTDGTIDQVSQAGVRRAFAKAVADDELIDKAKLAALVATETARGALTGLSAEAPLVATTGVLRMTVPRQDLGPDDAAEGTAVLDLKSLTLDARLGLATQSSGNSDNRVPLSAALTWKGPLFTPKREADTAALLQAVAVERLRIELERIELLEFDQREQAMFLRRLRAGRQKPVAPQPAPEPPAPLLGTPAPAPNPDPQQAAQQPSPIKAQPEPARSPEGTPAPVLEAGPLAAPAPALSPGLAPLPPPVYVPPAPFIAAPPGGPNPRPRRCVRLGSGPPLKTRRQARRQRPLSFNRLERRSWRYLNSIPALAASHSRMKTRTADDKLP